MLAASGLEELLENPIGSCGQNARARARSLTHCLPLSIWHGTDGRYFSGRVGDVLKAAVALFGRIRHRHA